LTERPFGRLTGPIAMSGSYQPCGHSSNDLMGILAEGRKCCFEALGR
jgi:hypothetical protein